MVGQLKIVNKNHFLFIVFSKAFPRPYNMCIFKNRNQFFHGSIKFDYCIFQISKFKIFSTTLNGFKWTMSLLLIIKEEQKYIQKQTKLVWFKV
jgi:hypothetical protein